MYLIMASEKSYFTGRCRNYFGRKDFADVSITKDINHALILKEEEWVQLFVKQYGGKILKIKLQEVV